jgi:hypothetical protein
MKAISVITLDLHTYFKLFPNWKKLININILNSINIPFGATSVVVEIAVVVSSVVVDVVVTSSMQRLSPEMQLSQESSMVGQLRNKMHSETG